MDFHFNLTIARKSSQSLEKGPKIFDIYVIFKSEYLHLCLDQGILFHTSNQLFPVAYSLIYLKTTEIS
jgi:hypothetical protein